MEVMSFKNGCTVSVPDNVAVLFASNSEGSERVEGVLHGDKCTVADLTLHMVEKIYSELDDELRSQFINGFVVIVQKRLPKNMQISSVTIRKGVSPEDDDE